MSNESVESFVSDQDLSTVPFREMPYLAPSVQCRREDDGSILLQSGIPLVEAEPSIPHLFRSKAKAHPERLWLAEKNEQGGWRKITYGKFDQLSDSVAQWLLDQGMGQSTPLMILSENSIDHAVITMGAMKAQVPVAPVSAPYSLMDPEFKKLSVVVDILKPTLVFAQCGERFGPALKALEDDRRMFIEAQSVIDGHVCLEQLLQTCVTEEVAASIDKIRPEAIAKYMFTSGSTGSPKCVLHTQSILCAQVAGLKSIRKPDDESASPPTSLQWMPWSHVSAGNIAYHEAIMNGGAIYIDDGRPTPALFEKTITNLREVLPSVFGSAPLGLGWLATALEQDPDLQQAFFKNLEAIAYGGSALPEDINRRLQILAVRNTGCRVPIISMYGSTETQGITATYWATDVPGIIGLPLPGMTLKLAPCADKLEVRVKGDTVFEHYYGEAELSAASFDDDGFFCLGDAARLADDKNPVRGLVFDGRLSEDFKLLSGTWVSTSNVKSGLLAALGSLVRELVICGENRSFLTALVWLDAEAAAEFLGGVEVATDQLIVHPEIEKTLSQRLSSYNGEQAGSSSRVLKVTLLKTLPSLSGGEINEKGYINTRVLLNRRANLLERMYRDPAPSDHSIYSESSD